jgi:tRNA pseudouridine38-40 synthase
MPKVALGVEYDGTELHGWQSQRGRCSVQEALTEALSRVADERVVVHGAGRTDAGVHATGQVAHFDTTAIRRPRSWLLGGNAGLPAGICLRWACEVPDTFHARFGARARTYSYLVLNRETRSALWRHRAWWVHRPLDVEQMHAAGQALVGEHDFSAFRAAECQAKNPVRTIQRLAVARYGEFLRLDVTANAFLHHMVRNIIGTLAAVGRGDRPGGWVGDVLAGRKRCDGGATAPAEGLYLVHVDYGELLSTPPPEWPGPK